MAPPQVVSMGSVETGKLTPETKVNPPRPRHRALSVPNTCRNPARDAPEQGMYVGIEIEARGPRPCYSIYVHDGFYGLDFTTQMFNANGDGKFGEVFDTEEEALQEEANEVISPEAQKGYDRDVPLNDTESLPDLTMSRTPSLESKHGKPITPQQLRIMEDSIVAWLRDYARGHHFKIHAAGIGVVEAPSIGEGYSDIYLLQDEDDPEAGKLRLPARLWFELDILPIIVETTGYMLDERACSAARKAQLYLNPHVAGNIPRISCGYRHEVEVDGNGRIDIADSDDFRGTVCPETWDVFTKLVQLTKQRNLNIAYFNSTPQGGGVALMRHALIRLLRIMGVEAKWFVMKPKPEIFDVTKRKFHNVLQGVGNAHLTHDDKRMFEQWAKDNVKRYWLDGPITKSDVIIIDDPQPCGIIPYIKKLNPKCKIIYRSHIEVTSQLADDPTTEQHQTWSYLWRFISQADVFVSHPVASFVPSCVPPEKLVMMPACTDELDGLNKDLTPHAIEYYQSVFNRISADTTGKKADFSRQYVCQISRFDPSKGIPHLLRAYRGFRQRLRDEGIPDDQTPQLIIAGHGSIDDPDGNVVFEEVLTILKEEKYAAIAEDIIPVRLPPSDQLLDALLRGAKVALQLSTREGFEIKITEALFKGIPVIAYRAGGIPHQIQHGRTGYLVEIGDIDTVIQHLYDFVMDEKLYAKMSAAAYAFVGEEYFTVFQTINWLWLINAAHSGFFEHPTADQTAKVNQERDDAILQARSSDTTAINQSKQSGVVSRALESGRPAAIPSSTDTSCVVTTTCSSPQPTEELEESDQRIEAEFEAMRKKLSGNGRWVKDFWQKEYLGGSVPRKRRVSGHRVVQFQE